MDLKICKRFLRSIRFLSNSPMKKCFLLCGLLILIPLFFNIYYNFVWLRLEKEHHSVTILYTQDDWCNLSSCLTKIFLDLIKLNVNKSLLNEYEKILNTMNCSSSLSAERTIREALKSNPVTNQNDSSKVKTLKADENNLIDVCPEIWMGMMYGYHKWYFEGFIMTNCTNAKPFADVLTIILNFGDCPSHCSDNIFTVLKGIEKVYPNITVMLAIPNNISPPILTNSLEINSAIYKIEGNNFMSIWNTMIKNVKTPYVFIGRDIEDFTWHSRLERQVRILSAFKSTGFVGGGNRDVQGNWTYDCYQLSMSNYILKYEDGYYKSKNECMLCHHLNGPFMAKTEVINNLKLQTSKNMFADMFLQAYQKNITTMSCPDAMNFIYGSTIHIDKNNWLDIAQTWKLNRILLPPNIVLKYSCAEVSIKCPLLTTTKNYLAPICCMEIMAEAINVFTKICENITICYADAGTLIAAVKFYGPMPWDWDADTFYDGAYYHALKQALQFKDHGYKIEWAKYGEVCCQNNVSIPYVGAHMYFYGMCNDIYPEKLMDGYAMPGKTPTRIKFGSYHIHVPINPGLYIRNHYGIEVLKHSQNWMVLNRKSSYNDYTSGKFLRCSNPSHHSCLDHFEADGNIPFRAP